MLSSSANEGLEIIRTNYIYKVRKGMICTLLYKKYLKRALDIIFSSLALLALSPIIGMVALLVRVKLGSPVVFKQPRPGMNEKIFSLYKFRSMTNEKGEDGRLLPDSQRLTKFGKFLRASSLDEILELVNIIKGDMSIVGPRPLSIYYLPHYPAEYRKRHDVRPGLTGLAQVNGRNNLPWEDRFKLDLEYVNTVSFRRDVQIILDTVMKVLKHSDVTVRGTTKVKDYGPYSILKEEGGRGKKVEGMTYSEIGSYFWMDGTENPKSEIVVPWLPSVSDSSFTFSGRNAIDIALRDILNNHKIDKVFVPSYSCVSMLQAFVDRGFDVVFYDVSFDNNRFTYKLPRADEHSVVLIMSYFGLNSETEQKAVREIHRKGAIIIEDITHSLLRKQPCSEESDYLVASLRKWFAIPTGGWVGKKNGELSEKPFMDSNHAVEEKINGMREKYDYLTGKISSKENFLQVQAKFDNDLIHVDRMLKIDDTSFGIIGDTDIRFVTERRKKNAEVLMNGLEDLNGAVLKLPDCNMEEDTPLFLPVFMKTEDRDSLRKYLIDLGIYCPVHWPEIMGASAGVRKNELSLICDQRYSEKDMQTIVEAIHSWAAAK